MNHAIIELCRELGIEPNALCVFFAHLTARTTSVRVAGMAANPSYTVLNYGNKSIPPHILDTEVVTIEKLPVSGKTVRGGYTERLHILVIDEKWARAQEKQHAD